MYMMIGTIIDRLRLILHTPCLNITETPDLVTEYPFS